MIAKRLLTVLALSLAGLMAITACTEDVQRQQGPTATSQGQATATPTSTRTQPVPPEIEVLSPQEGQVVSAGAVRVRVAAPGDATVAVNGVVAEAKIDGTFHADILLDDGANLIDISATDVSGGVAYEDVVVFVFDQGQGVSLDITGPADGYVTDGAYITLTGATDLDASVAVNGVPVSLNQHGIFETEVALEQGGNLIEVASVGSSGQENVQSVTVFREQ